MSEFNLKDNLGRLLAFAVAVILIILYWAVDINSIKRWVKGVEIEVVSPQRGTANEFLTNEKLRFVLKDIQTPKVVWVFDESVVELGDVEIEYAFPFNKSLPEGQARDRRIDAFYKSGDSYGSAFAFVRTRNVAYSAKADNEGDMIALKAQPTVDKVWSLDNVSVEKYAAGTFTDKVDVPFTEMKAGLKVFGINQGVAEQFLGDQGSEKNDWKTAFHSSPNVWATYEFSNQKTNEKLTLSSPIFKKPEE